MLHLKLPPIEKVALFLILYLANSFAVCNDIISTPVTICLWLVVAGILILHGNRIRSGLALFTITVALCMGVTVIVRSENIITFFMVLFSYVVVLLFVNKIGYSTFSVYYRDIMYKISIVSLVFFAAYILFPALYRINPVTTTTVYSNLYIYVDTPKYTRNMGLFWEPGAYQTFLIIALLMEISSEEKEIKYKRIFVYIITIITTYSTTGYIALMLVMVAFLLKRSKSTKTKIFTMVVAIVLVGLVYFGHDLLFGRVLNNGQSTVFGKVLTFINGGQVSSVSVRYYSIVKPFEAFIESPIFGKGRTGLSNQLFYFTRGMNTCTFINWFAIYGLLYGIMMIYGIWGFSRRISKDKTILTEWVFFILFIITMSETYVDNPMMFIFILYGFELSQSKQLLDRDRADI